MPADIPKSDPAESNWDALRQRIKAVREQLVREQLGAAGDFANDVIVACEDALQDAHRSPSVHEFSLNAASDAFLLWTGTEFLVVRKNERTQALLQGCSIMTRIAALDAIALVLSQHGEGP